LTARTFLIPVLFLMVSVLVACGGSSDPVVRGRQIYDKQGCNACHSIGGQGGTTGPDQTRLAVNAEGRIKDPGYKGNARDAAGYIRESILQPGAYVVPGFPDNLMPTTFGQQLSAQDLDDLLSYLLTLK
jgi:nitric oxide reductase subunit C